MKRILNIATCIGLILMTGSCNDFLDRFPTDEVGSNTVFSSADLAESAVVGAYSAILYDYVSSDLARRNWDVFAGILDTTYSNFYQYYIFLNGTIQPNNGLFSTYWKRLYEGVNRANDVINNIGDVNDLPEAVRAQRIAECKFLRAYNYYKLNALWGGVPWYPANMAPVEYTRARETQDAIWEKIVQDLTDCIECESLPNKNGSGSADFGRVTKGAAYALRGKVYMWQKKWSEAEKDLKAVSTMGYGLLQAPYADLFTLKNETCDEMIFSARMVELSGSGNTFSRNYGNFTTAGNGYTAYSMSTHVVDSYQNSDGSEFKWSDFFPNWDNMSPEARSVYFLRDGLTPDEKAAMSAYGADISQYLDSGNEARIMAAYASRDPRLAATVITPYSTYKGGCTGKAETYTRRFPFRAEQSPQFDVRTNTNGNFNYCLRKFVTVGMEYSNATYNPVDVPIIRYAQVLLDLAEAINEQGRTSDAVQYINQVRTRAGMPGYNSGPAHLQVSSKEDLRARIILERRWELAGEEVIYYDELRQGTWKDFRFAKGNGNVEPWGTTVYDTLWGGNEYMLWAIPSKEVEMNSNLVQNEGWRG